MNWGSIHPVEFRGSAGSRERTLPAREVEENYREGQGLYVLLSRTQAGPGRTVKQEQEEISRNHVH